MLGFVGGVGDLAKLVRVREGAREIPGGRDTLAHELADCLWSVFVLSNAYENDIARESQQTMRHRTTHI